MDHINPLDIPDIFVGRTVILSQLQYMLNKIQKKKQADIVRILLNTPGIGKTKTIEHFGKSLMQCQPFPADNAERDGVANHALYIQITISNSDSLDDIYKKINDETIAQFQVFYTTYPDLYPRKWAKQLNPQELNGFDDLNIMKMLAPLSPLENIAKNPFFIITPISRQIPIILHFDEFQESIHGDDKQVYYDLGTFLAGILKFPIFSILTGTKFTIMRTIGSNRISPLNGKVDEIVLKYLLPEEQELLVKEIFSNPQSETERTFIKYYKNWLLANSGGHPRTIEFMTKKCIKKLSLQKNTLFSEEQLETRGLNTFFNELDNKMGSILEGLFWKSKYKEFLAEKLRNIPLFLQQKIILYLTNILETNLKIPDLIDGIKKAPGLADEDYELVEEFLSTLVQAGYLLINGNGNFYIPSRYALQAFLKDWSQFLPNWYIVLQEFLNNPVVREIMYHSPQSLGWTFEVFVKYGILALMRDTSKVFPHAYVKFIGIESSDNLPALTIPTEYGKRDGDVDLPVLETIPEHVYVVLPAAKGIDALVKDGNRILALQITSGKDQGHLVSKFKNFRETVRELNENLQAKKSDISVIPWFLSLNAFLSPKIVEGYSGLITEGAQWDQMIGTKD